MGHIRTTDVYYDEETVVHIEGGFNCFLRSGGGMFQFSFLSGFTFDYKAYTYKYVIYGYQQTYEDEFSDSFLDIRSTLGINIDLFLLNKVAISFGGGLTVTLPINGITTMPDYEGEVDWIGLHVFYNLGSPLE